MLNLGGRVKEVRKDFKLTQKEFSKRLESSPSHISGIESDTVPISDRLIKLICMQFNVNENWLRYEEGDKYNQSKTIDAATSKLEMIEGIESLNQKIVELSGLLKSIPDEEVTQVTYCLSHIINVLNNRELQDNLRFEYLDALEDLFSDLDRYIQNLSYTTSISYEKTVDDKGKDIDTILSKYLKPFTRAFEQLGEAYLLKYIAGYDSLKDELSATLVDTYNNSSYEATSFATPKRVHMPSTFTKANNAHNNQSLFSRADTDFSESTGRAIKPQLIFMAAAQSGKTNTSLTLLSEFLNSQNAKQHSEYIAEEKSAYVPNLGKVAAGSPIDLIEYNSGLSPIFGIEDVDFTLQVSGDSMEPDIPNGSYVFVKKQEALENGQIGIIMINDQVVCKRFYKANGHVELKSINKKYEPIVLKGGDVRILGKVVRA